MPRGMAKKTMELYHYDEPQKKAGLPGPRSSLTVGRTQASCSLRAPGLQHKPGIAEVL